MESMDTGSLRGADKALREPRLEPPASLSSTNESQAPQSGHLPIHFGV
jgi:hypothetical protein